MALTPPFHFISLLPDKALLIHKKYREQTSGTHCSCSGIEAYNKSDLTFFPAKIPIKQMLLLAPKFVTGTDYPLLRVPFMS